MERLLRSWDNAASYPDCLISHRTYEHVLQDSKQRLHNRDDLFCDEDKAQVDFLQYDHCGQGKLHSLSN